MSRNYILSYHIQKLDHRIDEIRVRALKSIISKLNHGFLYDNDLARSKELLIKLFEWFTLNPVLEQETVLKLMKRILLSQSGATLIAHIGAATLLSELNELHNYVQETYRPLLDEIIMHIQNYKTHPLVPPLETGGVPLSYRSGVTMSDKMSPPVGTTASPIDVFVKDTTPHLQEAGDPVRGSPKMSGSSSSASPRPYNVDAVERCLPHSLFGWQPLIASDRHVLKSVESSLTEPTDPAILLHTCSFIHDVLLQDFPAEVFLQRPAIVKQFHVLLNSNPSSRICTAVVSCLIKLTESLHVRVHYYTDPSTHNLKQEKCTSVTPDLELLSSSAVSQPGSPLSSHFSARSGGGDSHNDYYLQATASTERCEINTDSEDSVLLQLQQLSLPQYCIQTLYYAFVRLAMKNNNLKNNSARSSNVQNCVNSLLNLIFELIRLTLICVRPDVWQHRSEPTIREIVHQLTLLLTKLGDVLHHSRLLMQTSDIRPVTRANHLNLLVLTKSLLSSMVPLQDSDAILPRHLKEALASCLLDASLASLYPQVHDDLCAYVKEFRGHLEADSLLKYKDTKNICKSMSSAVEILRSSSKHVTPDIFRVFSESFASLEFHRNFNYIKMFVEICINKLPKWKLDEERLNLVEDIMLSLFSHNDVEVKSAMYSACHVYVVGVLGADQVTQTGPSRPAECLTFLWRSSVLIEIICHGLSSDNTQIQRHAEDMIISILKAKVLVSERVWQQILSAVIPALPLLHCYANKTSVLGRAITKMLDPDVANSLSLPAIEVLKGNLRLLFAIDSLTRNEAISRLTWLIATEERSNEKLPHLKSLQGLILNTVCFLENPVDLTKVKPLQAFYQVGSLCQVIDLLLSFGIEPNIRKSAITQINVMLEDHILHKTFLEQDGLKLIMNVYQNALTEKEFQNYPDNAVPIVNILKNLCLHNPAVRQELSLRIDVYFLILRTLFLFSGNDQLRANAAQLLTLLLFSDFTLTLQSAGTHQASIPALVSDKLQLPFVCRTHWRTSRHTKPSLAQILSTDDSSMSILRLHWNAEWHGGLSELVTWSQIPCPASLTPEQLAEFSGDLRLTKSDLANLKYSSLEHCCKQYLFDIQNASSHDFVNESIQGLTSYLLLKLSTQESEQNKSETSILDLPWESSIGRFLSSPPTSTADAELLTSILRFLQLFIKIFQITAYLDSILNCLVHITASFGWSNIKDLNRADMKRLQSDLAKVLIELVGAFHCGKGSAAATSFMGLSITRNSVLTMNHILCEMQTSGDKEWESYWLCASNESCNDSLQWLVSLWNSRDVVLRAATFQLLANLAASHRSAAELVLGLKHLSCNGGMWAAALATLLHHCEASVVREQAAMLLTNLSSHVITVSENRPSLALCHAPTFTDRADIDSVDAIAVLLDSHNFYSEVNVLLSCLYLDSSVNRSSTAELANWKVETTSGKTIRPGSNLKTNEYVLVYTKTIKSARSTESSKSTEDSLGDLGLQVVTTPSLIKATARFITNLLTLAPQQTVVELNEYGVVQNIFRCLSNCPIEISDNRSLIFYVDVLEMNTAICNLLTTAVSLSNESHATVLHLRDCLNVLLLLLDNVLYYTHIPHLLHLRNQLWNEVFKLLTMLLVSSSHPKSYFVISSSLNECGYQTFFKALCESASSSTDLQQSALSSLTSLLSFEIDQKNDNPQINDSLQSVSMQNILDTLRTPNLSSTDHFDVESNVENTNPKRYSERNDFISPRSIERYSNRNVLKNIQLNNVRQYNKRKIKNRPVNNALKSNAHDCVTDETSGAAVTGAELARILIKLYNIHCLKNNYSEGAITQSRNKDIVIKALTSILCLSNESKRMAVREGLLETVVVQLRELHVRLSLESVDCLKRISDKKRVCPALNEISNILDLLMNFLNTDEKVKLHAVELGLADLVHKLWVWLMSQQFLLIKTLKLLCTFTSDCLQACQSIPLTSAVAGVGPRKTPSNLSLLHALVAVVSKEMEQVTRSHELSVLTLTFYTLQNCCQSQECRILLGKSNLFLSISRLHPAISKHQKPWDLVESLWLEFLEVLTGYPEGQTIVPKANDVLDIVMALTSSPNPTNKLCALTVLRNIAFCQANRTKLLSSVEFIYNINTKLSSGTLEEQCLCVTIVWSLVANNQKGKFTLKSAGVDLRLQELLKNWRLTDTQSSAKERMDSVAYVLRILQDNR